MSVLSQPPYNNEEAARQWLEALRWPDGPVCPHCGTKGHAYEAPQKGKRKDRPGRYRCGNPTCRKDFSVTIGTLFERSHIPLHKWLTAFHLLGSSKKGMSAHQLHRTLELSYKSAWFMAHRIREAMKSGALDPLGGAGKAVEADETDYGEKADPAERRKPGQRGPAGKRPVVGLVERGGKVRTFHVEKANKDTIEAIVRANVSREAALMTDESALYAEVGGEFASHETVCHSAGEYVRGDVHTNTMDGYWGLFKRGMRGIYQHCAEKHLHRYLAEFDFRYNNRVRLGVGDVERATLALKGIEGRRLTYRQPDA
jgi:transposase-like protein